MPARSVCLVTLSLSEAGPGRFGCQVSVTDIYHTIPYQARGPAIQHNIVPSARAGDTAAAVAVAHALGTGRQRC